MITKELTDLEKKVRFNEIVDLLNKLGTAIIDKDFSVKLRSSSKWDYHKEENEFEYDESTIYQLSDRWVFAKLVDALAVAKFYKNPEPKKLDPYMKEPTQLCVMFWNYIGEMQLQEQMIEAHPGTYTILEYMFCKEDAEISGDIEKKLPPHLQFLHALPKLFWKKPISHFDKEVKEALEKSEDALFRSCFHPDITQALIIASVEIWDTFYSLYKDPPEEDGSGSWSGSGKQEMKEATEKVQSMHTLKELMKEMSKDMNGEWDSKESFQADIEKEFDERESKDVVGGAPDTEEMDDILEKAKETEEWGWVGASPNTKYEIRERIPYENLYKEVYHLIPPLKKKLGSIMKDNIYDREGGSYRSGKLNTKKLYKVATWSDKVFKRKIERSHKDYKVTILVDESGSMTSDKKNYYAALGCVLLSEVLATSHIDFEIIGFNGTIRVYKKFWEKFWWNSRDNIEKIIPNSYHGADIDSNPWCNDDGYAINYATHRMRKSSTQYSERMLFVLSDGQPAPSGRMLPQEEQDRTWRPTTSNSNFDLRSEIEFAERDSYVFGIGINARCVENYYDNCAIVDDVSELPEVMLSQLKTMIKRW